MRGVVGQLRADFAVRGSHQGTVARHARWGDHLIAIIIPCLNLLMSLSSCGLIGRYQLRIACKTESP